MVVAASIYFVNTPQQVFKREVGWALPMEARDVRVTQHDGQDRQCAQPVDVSPIRQHVLSLAACLVV